MFIRGALGVTAKGKELRAGGQVELPSSFIEVLPSSWVGTPFQIGTPFQVVPSGGTEAWPLYTSLSISNRMLPLSPWDMTLVKWLLDKDTTQRERT